MRQNGMFTYKLASLALCSTNFHCSSARVTPVYLSSADSPRNIVCPVTLNGQNYSNWSRLMMNALKAKNKLGFVNGKLKKPNAGAIEEDAWERCNSMVTGWLYNVIDKNLYGSISFANSARDIWRDLEERYCPGNAIRIHQIKTEITLLGQGNLHCHRVFHKIEGVVGRIEYVPGASDMHMWSRKRVQQIA